MDPTSVQELEDCATAFKEFSRLEFPNDPKSRFASQLPAQVLFRLMPQMLTYAEFLNILKQNGGKFVPLVPYENGMEPTVYATIRDCERNRRSDELRLF